MSDDGPRTRLYLIRHAATAKWTVGRCCGRTDVALSDAGRQYAERLATDFAEVQFEAVYSSPSLRARETAAPIAVAAKRTMVLIQGLSEIDFGSFDGRTFAEIASTDPDLYERWMADPTTVRFPGGESYTDLKSRSIAAINEIVLRHRGATVVAATHAGPIRAILGFLLEIPDHAVFRLDIPHGSVSLVEWLGDEPVVRRLNAVGEGVRL